MWCQCRESEVYDGFSKGNGCKRRMATHLEEKTVEAVPEICQSLRGLLCDTVRAKMCRSTYHHMQAWGNGLLRAFRNLFGEDMRERQKALMDTKNSQLGDELSALTAHLKCLASPGKPVPCKEQKNESEEKEPEEEEKEPEEKMECLACGEFFFASEMFPRCERGHTICKKCAREYINVKIDAKQFPIVCPGFRCDLELRSDLALKVLENEERTRAYEISLQGWLVRNSNVAHCPYPNCTVSVEVRPSEFLYGRSPRTLCQGCGQTWCLRCKVVWHNGKTCAAYQEEALDEKEWDMIQRAIPTSVRCPDCKRAIEKIQGCNHMTCDRSVGGCGAHFCNLCSARLSSNNPYIHFSSGDCQGQLFHNHGVEEDY